MIHIYYGQWKGNQCGYWDFVMLFCENKSELVDYQQEISYESVMNKFWIFRHQADLADWTYVT